MSVSCLKQNACFQEAASVLSLLFSDGCTCAGRIWNAGSAVLSFESVTFSLVLLGSLLDLIHTLPKTNIAPENQSLED